MATFFSSNWPHFCGICEIFHFSSQITATNHDALFQSIYSTLKLMYEIGSYRDILKIQRTRAGSYREEGYDWLLNFFLPMRMLITNSFEDSGSGQVVSVLAFHSDDSSLNAAEVYSFYSVGCLKRKKINKKRLGLAHLLKNSFDTYSDDQLTIELRLIKYTLL